MSILPRRLSLFGPLEITHGIFFPVNGEPAGPSLSASGQNSRAGFRNASEVAVAIVVDAIGVLSPGQAFGSIPRSAFDRDTGNVVLSFDRTSVVAVAYAGVVAGLPHCSWITAIAARWATPSSPFLTSMRQSRPVRYCFWDCQDRPNWAAEALIALRQPSLSARHAAPSFVDRNRCPWCQLEY